MQFTSISLSFQSIQSLGFHLSVICAVSLFSTCMALGQETDSTAIISIPTAETQTQEDTIKRPRKSRAGFHLGAVLSRFQISNEEEKSAGFTFHAPIVNAFYAYQITPSVSAQVEIGWMRFRNKPTPYRIANVDGMVRYSIECLELALLGQYSYPINEQLQIGAQIGIAGGFVRNSTGRVKGKNQELALANYLLDADRQFETFNAGVLIGIQTSYQFKRLIFSGGLRFRHGLSQLNTFDPRLNRYLAYGNKEINTQNIILHVGAGFVF